jgi:hypothetical protein
MVAVQALERARDEQGAPLFLIKGGVMIELRLGLRARATKDLDAVFRAQFDAWLDQLDDAISRPVGGFTLARTEPEEIKQTGTQRLQLIIDYRGRRWAQVPLEVAPVEAPDEVAGEVPEDLSGLAQLEDVRTRLIDLRLAPPVGVGGVEDRAIRISRAAGGRLLLQPNGHQRRSVARSPPRSSRWRLSRTGADVEHGDPRGRALLTLHQ